MREVRIALIAGLALLAVAIAIALARSPMTVARTNGPVGEEARIGSLDHGATFCQGGEPLPSGVTAIRLSWFAFAGPRVRVVVYAHGRAVTSGERGSGWTGREVTVTVAALRHAVSDTTVCGSFQMKDEALTVFGKPTPRAQAAHDGPKVLGGRFWIEYLRPGTRSWASLVPSILGHMGLGRASSGPGIVVIALLLLVAVVVLSSRLVLRELS
jgi:hypothetical protein